MNYHYAPSLCLLPPRTDVMYACGGHRTYNTAAALSALSRARVRQAGGVREVLSSDSRACERRSRYVAMLA